MNVLPSSVVAELASAFAEQKGVRETARECDVDRETVGKYFAQFREEGRTVRAAVGLTRVDSSSLSGLERFYDTRLVLTSEENLKLIRQLFVGARVAMNRSCPGSDWGRVGSVTYIPTLMRGDSNWVRVEMDDTGRTVDWHVSYFDLLPS